MMVVLSKTGTEDFFVRDISPVHKRYYTHYSELVGKWLILLSIILLITKCSFFFFNVKFIVNGIST